MEYSVVQSESLRELVNEVREKIAQGWKAQGGVSVEVVPVPKGELEKTPKSHQGDQVLTKWHTNSEAVKHSDDYNHDLAMSVDEEIQASQDGEFYDDEADERDYMTASDGYEDEDVDADYYDEEEEEYEEEVYEEDESEELVYLTRYVQVIVREARWNRKFTFNPSAGRSAGSRGDYYSNGQQAWAYGSNVPSSPQHQDYRYRDGFDPRTPAHLDGYRSHQNYSLSRRVPNQPHGGEAESLGLRRRVSQARPETLPPHAPMSQRRQEREPRSPLSNSTWKGQGGYADHNPYEEQASNPIRDEKKSSKGDSKSALSTAVKKEPSNDVATDSATNVKKLSRPLELKNGKAGQAKLLGRGRNNSNRNFRQQVNRRNK